MKRIKLSDQGPDFSNIVFGTMNWGSWGGNLNPHQTLTLIEKSMELGITTFDHADIYGDYTTEFDFGKALGLKPEVRQKMELVTKCAIKLVTPNRSHHHIKSYDASQEHILFSVDNSLKALKTDYIDLLLIHRPDPLMNPNEVANAFERLKKEGKVRHFGVSNFTPSQFEMLNDHVSLATNQVQASIQHLDPFLDGTLDQCIQKKIIPMAWSPLGGGKIFKESTEPHINHLRQVIFELAHKYHVPLDQMMLAWLMKHPSQIIPIIGTTKIERVHSAVEATQLDIDREDWFKMWEASTGEEVA